MPNRILAAMAERRSKRSAPTDESAGSPPRVDAIISELEGHVDALESGELALEDALTRFEAGVRLARQGTSMLDALEHRVEMLLGDGEDTVPFGDAADEPDLDADDE